MNSRKNYPSYSLVRIRLSSSDSAPSGSGLYICDNLILSCYHVISDTLDENLHQEKDIWIDFPMILPEEHHLPFKMKIIAYDESEDIALLQPIENIELPKNARPTKLVSYSYLNRHNFIAWGFNYVHPEGIQSEGVILGSNAKGWYQTERINQVGYAIVPGFSGTPIWDNDIKGIVGIAIANDRDPSVKIGFILPTMLILKALEDKIPYSLYAKLVYSEGPGIIKKALKELLNENYNVVIRICERVLEEDNKNIYCNVIYAIALMRRENTNRNNIKEIEIKLKNALKSDPQNSLTWSVWGIIRHDYYFKNNVRMGEPSLSSIKKQLEDSTFTEFEVSIIKNVIATQEAIEYFRLVHLISD